MDRNIPKEVRRKILFRRLITAAAFFIALIAVIIVTVSWLSGGVDERDLDIRTADKGEIRSAVIATGRILPAFEEIIVSPVNTRILEVYVNEGDSVAKGTPLLRLDIEEARNNYRRLADELSIKRSEINSQELSDETQLTDLEMRIRTKQLAVEQLNAEYASECRLDSIGSGTGERVRQAKLAWQTATLELEQMKRQLSNERRIRQAMATSKQIEGNISSRNLAEASRTLDEARVGAPRSGIVSFISSEIGSTVASGERIAVVSDNSNFKVSGELPEGYGEKLCVGGPVEVRSGRYTYSGQVSHVAAQSKSGMIPFVVRLDKADAEGLRAGMTARISIIYDIKPDVVRIPHGSFFNGPGDYQLYVMTAPDRMERRKVRLGDSNLDFIEVVSGLHPGEQVNVNAMDATSEKLRVRVRQ